jgi:hypothetical protein
MKKKVKEPEWKLKCEWSVEIIDDISQYSLDLSKEFEKMLDKAMVEEKRKLRRKKLKRILK